MFAHNRYGLLIVFQALDAAGKDGTIQQVFTGTNPAGVRVYSFKRPTDQELDHDFLWRSWRELPERGTIGIFNRSYYEEVLVTKVHPEILTESQRLPEKMTEDLDKLFKHRYDAIRDMEKFLATAMVFQQSSSTCTYPKKNRPTALSPGLRTRTKTGSLKKTT